MASLPGAALWYAERGCLLFPLRPGTKVPATTHGLKDASMSPDTVRAWWSRWPDANIGLVTGHYADVIDVDGEDGIRSIAQIEDEGLLPEFIGIVATPGDARIGRDPGYHLYLPPSGDGNAAGIRPGIDVRGRGGYVLAPPSLIDGKPYRWIQPPTIPT